MAVRVVVAVELIGVEPGLWCHDCLLSTGARLWYTTTTNGATSMRDKVFCTEGKDHRVDASSD